MSSRFIVVRGRHYNQSVGANEELREISDNGNFNFVKHPLQSEILFALLFKEGPSSFYHNTIVRKAVQMMGIGPMIGISYGFSCRTTAITQAYG